jgi:ABC-2 type transport system permease protein
MTESSTYKPTFLQKFLGKNYKWWYAFKYEWAKTGASSFADLILQFQIFISNSLWIYIWSLNSVQNVIYLLTGRVFNFLISNFWYGRIGSDIIFGSLNNILLLPNSIFKIYFFQSLGARLYRNIMSTVTIFIVALLFNFYVVKIPLSFNFLFLLPFLPLVFCINFFTAILIGSIAFFINDKRDFSHLTEVIQQILNIFIGLFIPLNQVPFLGSFLIYLPFSICFYHPTQIYLGKYTNLEIFYVFLGGLAWCFVLYFLAKLVFKMGLKRNEAVGL